MKCRTMVSKLKPKRCAPTRPDLILQAGLPLRSGLIVVLCGDCCGHFNFAAQRTFQLLRHIVCMVEALGRALPHA
ncbi:hypothetical protein BSY240_625 [Agrobacterium sp. RAC06]|nr:hypothetical protein BSY240_625 [Agrobacterium sp. RAC06]